MILKSCGFWQIPFGIVNIYFLETNIVMLYSWSRESPESADLTGGCSLDVPHLWWLQYKFIYSYTDHWKLFLLYL